MENYYPSLKEATDYANLYSFSHKVIQEAIYENIPFNQRKMTHKLVAQWFESTSLSGKQNNEFSPSLIRLLAFHWRAAGEYSKSLPYYEQLGELVMNSIN